MGSPVWTPREDLDSWPEPDREEFLRELKRLEEGASPGG
jgi:hypothetical protein